MFEVNNNYSITLDVGEGSEGLENDQNSKATANDDVVFINKK